MLWAATVYNNTPQATIGGAVPAQRLYGHSLIDLKKFRVFGCDAYVYIDNDKRGKIEPKFRKSIFVGILALSLLVEPSSSLAFFRIRIGVDCMHHLYHL